MQIKNILIPLVLIGFLVGCTSYDFSRRVVEQGNLLPKSKIEQLKVGLAKEQVALIMGTSLLNPVFDDNRWDYVYTWRKGSGELERHKLSLYFMNNVLSRIDSY